MIIDWLSKRAYFKIKPTHCNHCGQELVTTIDSASHDMHTGKITKYRIRVRCPRQRGHIDSDPHSILVWDDYAKNLRTYRAELPPLSSFSLDVPGES